MKVGRTSGNKMAQAPRGDPFRRAVTRFRPILLLTVVFSFFGNLLLFVGPLYMLQIYDRVLQSRSGMTLLMLTLIAAVLLALYGVMDFIRSRLLARAGMRFDGEVAEPLIYRVMQSGGNRTAHLALADLDRVKDVLVGNALLTLCDIPWVPIFLGVCFLFHPVLGLVATCGAAVLFILAALNAVMTRNRLRAAATAAHDANSYATASLKNSEVIQALAMDRAIGRRWLEKRERVIDCQSAAGDRAGLILSFSRFVRAALQVLILGAGAWLVLGGEITPGVMIAASIMLGRALAPVEQSVIHWQTLSGARDSYRRLKNFFADTPEPRLRTELPVPKGRVEVRGLVGQAPESEATVLAGINFEVAPGEVLAVIGPSGAGKSSLVRHLVGYWQPRAGHVRLDGSDLHHWNRDELGRRLGYLPQDVELFQGTVAENIARFGRQDDKAVVEAARQAGVHEMIQSLPDGYETEVGDNGAYLSAGQRQRVALARALYGDPALVVLDEPNSNLDTDGDEALLAAIDGLKERRRTVVFVTHRPNLLGRADKALVLRSGRQTGFGPARDLMHPRMARHDAGTPSRATAAAAVTRPDVAPIRTGSAVPAE